MKSPLSMSVGGDLWWEGLTAELTFTNNSNETLTNWTYSFTTDHKIEGIPWGLSISEVPQANGTTKYTLTGADWAQQIPPGGSVIVGFNAKQGKSIGNEGSLTANLLFNEAVNTSSNTTSSHSNHSSEKDTNQPSIESSTTQQPPENSAMADMHDHHMHQGSMHDAHSAHASSNYTLITEWGASNGSQHTTHGELTGGRTPITTEALVAYNNLRSFLGLNEASVDDVGRWAFANNLTNNTQAWGDDLKGVGLWYAMQGAKVGWIADGSFNPQSIADLQRTARLGDPNDVIAMADDIAKAGFIDHLKHVDGIEAFINTLKMEPHFGGWMHDRAHGWLSIEDVAIAHDINHLTVLSHDQMQPFMNDTFDWPQWDALKVSHQTVIDYFQSIATLSDPLSGDNFAFDIDQPDPIDASDNQQMNHQLDTPEEVSSTLLINHETEKNLSGQLNYAEALQKSFLFYEANRSGDLDEASKRINWRGDSNLSDGFDGIYFGDRNDANLQEGLAFDLTGGYFDAGDHGKFGLPLASTLTTLSWGGIEHAEGYAASEQTNELLSAVRWGTDYLLKAHVTDNSGNTEFFVVQVGDVSADHALWSAPETQNIDRPAMAITPDKPGSDVAAQSAAALASASILFRNAGDVEYAETLLKNAEQLFEFANDYRGKYSNSVTEVQGYYASWSGYYDDLALGAAWLARANEAAGKDGESYRNQALDFYRNNIGGLNNGWTHNWDDTSYAAAVILAQDSQNVAIKQDVEGWLNNWVNGGNGVTITDGGLRFISQWGSLRYAANTAFLAGIYADNVNDPGQAYSKLSQSTVNYILGDNPAGISYMVGYGESYPQQPHHRAASGVGWNDFRNGLPNENILYGALVGGPSSADDYSYNDSRDDYISNEVAIDYNAGITGALARSIEQLGGEPMSSDELNSLRGVSYQDTGEEQSESVDTQSASDEMSVIRTPMRESVSEAYSVPIEQTSTEEEPLPIESSTTQQPPENSAMADMHDHHMHQGSMHDAHSAHASSNYTLITEWGASNGSQHTTHGELTGGRTPITTEALVAYNNLRSFLGLNEASVDDVGRWAFANNLTNNTQAWGDDLKGVGLWYAMQGAKVGWIADGSFNPQSIADLQRTARLGDPNDVIAMADDIAKAGFIDHLKHVDGIEAFINTLKMEPHFGGWMHDRAHGWLSIEDVAIAHDINHLTVLSHDQMQPFMNDTFDWPQWDALKVSHQTVIDYFQSIATLSDPLSGDNFAFDIDQPDPIDASDNQYTSQNLLTETLTQPETAQAQDQDQQRSTEQDLITGMPIEIDVSGELWWNGFTAKLILTNTSDQNLENWSVMFKSPHEIDLDAWGVDISKEQLEDNDFHYILTGSDWGTSIDSWQSISVGFNAIQGVQLGNSGELTADTLLASNSSFMPVI